MIVITALEIIIQAFPPEQRVDWFMDYVKAACKPLETLFTDFYAFFDKTKYELTFSGQVIYLEHVLNDQFDPDDRGIYITDSDLVESVFIFRQEENNEPTNIFIDSEGEPPVYLYMNQEYDDDVDFVVNVPASVTFNENELKYWVNKYRIAPMRWKIEIV